MPTSSSKTRSGSRAAHEARTGMVANMLGYGWRCVSWTKGEGRPTRFERWVGNNQFLVLSVTGGEWVVRYVPEYIKRPMVWDGQALPYPNSPKTPGPVALAAWFEMEIANGSHNSATR